MQPVDETELSQPDANVSDLPGGRKRWTGRAGALVYEVVLVAVFFPILSRLIAHVAASELHSYILLVPFVSAYLIYIERSHLPKGYVSSPVPATLAAGIGLAVSVLAWVFQLQTYLSDNDYLGLMTFAFLCLAVAGGFFFLGAPWMRAVAFPVGFLFFLIPMPDAMVDALETASKLGSTQTASWFFAMSGVPYMRQGTVFLLPDISIQVAQECSGIRSSWILLITSLLGSYLFLRAPWRRATLVAFVIPLGLLRNGFRILVIGLLCVHYGPAMIDSPIHHQGGPIFFALSLGPLLLFLWWLRRGDGKGEKARSGSSERGARSMERGARS